MTSVLTSHAHRPVSAPPELTLPLLHRTDPLGPVREGLAALGVTVATLPGEGRARQPLSAGSRLAVTLPGGHRARVECVVSVTAYGDDESLVSVAMTLTAGDGDAGRCLRAAWPLLRPALESVTARLLRSVDALTDDLAESPAAVVDPELSLAA